MTVALRRVGSPTGCAVLFAALVPLTSLGAQLRYSERAYLAERQRCGITFDELRGRMVLFGGTTTRTGLTGGTNQNDTWEWEQGGWVRRGPPQSPSPTDQGSAIAYDAPNKRVIYFVFNSGTRQGETWRYDGRQWARFLGVTTHPQFRQNYATAFDPRRGVMVLFGGADTSGMILDTWEFDGTDWRQIATPGPTGRHSPAMAYDGVNQRILLFGGRSSTQQPLGDTWSWDGTSWTPLSPSESPSPRHSAATEWDPVRGRVVLFGGTTGLPGTRQGDTWEWNGTTWARRTPATSPSARNGHAMTFRSDRGKIVIACGDTAGGVVSDTWEYDGNTWNEVVPAEAPVSRSEHASTYHAGTSSVLLFGGKDATNAFLNDTWAWSIGSWHEVRPATSPSARSDHAMVYDSARGRTVLFGGFGATGVLGDTWLFDGTTWTQASPTTAPPGRMGHTMIFDPLRNVVLMFGGSRGSTVVDELWEWNGTDWTLRTPTLKPVARWNHGMAFDRTNNVAVLYGGRNSFGGKLNDTWIWDGATGTWAQRSVTSPAARDNFVMDYDPIRQRVMVFSGFGASTYVSDTWDWSGSAWASVFAFPAPAPRQGATMTFDLAGGRQVIFGGTTTAGARQDTWLFTTKPVQQFLGHGTPCPGATGQATLSGFGNPVIGANSFAIDLVSPTPPTTVPVFFVLTAAAGSVTIGNCTLALDANTIFYTAYRLQYGVGFASMALPIPANVNLFGIQFYAVAAYVDPPTQLNGLAFSQQAKITIGD